MAEEVNALTLEALYDGADIQQRDFPVDQIKFVGISVVQYSDVSIVLKAPNLEVAVFRLCGFQVVPPPFFELSKLRSLDLSGNALSTLPGSEEWEKMKSLRSLNLGDNNITEITEIYKMQTLPELTQLLLAGNICLSAQDSFNDIVQRFPKLQILNDMIITSQHRAHLQDLAIFDPNSLVPSAKIDDYVFLYVKYMHASSNERFVRRSNVEHFCLHKVIRKYSAADKIQSVFRGYLQRTRYKVILHAARFLSAYIKFWYYKRFKAAMRIKSCFLYYRTRQQIKYIRAVRCVQSAWRKKMSRQDSLGNIFEYQGKWAVYLKPECVSQFTDLLKQLEVPQPDSIEETQYVIIKECTPTTVSIPGSPVVYYNSDRSALIRLRKTKSGTPAKSIWCGHDHSIQRTKTKVTRKGINSSKKCLFEAVKVVPQYCKSKAPKLPNYTRLMRLTFSDPEGFTKAVRISIASPKMQSVRLFPDKSLRAANAHVVVQSAMRAFFVRSRIFKEMKRQVLEKRAMNQIRYCIRTMRMRVTASHIAKVNRYMQSLPDSNCFYVPQEAFQKFLDIKPKFRVKFGYAADRSVILNENMSGFLPSIIPQGPIVFAVGDLQGLLKVGTIITKAQSTMFSIPVGSKNLRRFGITRVSCAKADEAIRRMALFAWMTDSYNELMTENDVVEYCAATTIQNAWIGYTMRKTMEHYFAQTGKSLKISMVRREKREAPPEPQEKKKREVVQHEADPVFFTGKQPTRDPVEMIHQLRGDYRPWATELDQYRKDHERIPKPTKRAASVVEDISPSAKHLGLVTDVGKDFARVPSTSLAIKRDTVTSIEEQLVCEVGESDDDRMLFLTGSPKHRSRLTVTPMIESDPPTPMFDSTALDNISVSSMPSILETETSHHYTSTNARTAHALMRQKIRHAFTKLVRLHQIGIAVERCTVVDNSIEVNRINAIKARERLEDARYEAEQTKSRIISETQARNRIERNNITDELNEKKYQETKRRSRRIEDFKKQMISRQEKQARDRRFGQQFVSMSRLVAQKGERERSSKLQLAKLSQVRQTVSELRKTSLARHAMMKEQLLEIDEQKKRLALIDRLITENKRQLKDAQHNERLHEIHETKRKEKERRILAKTTKMPLIPFVPETNAAVKQDPLELAATEMKHYIGETLGLVESRILAEIVQDILN